MLLCSFVRLFVPSFDNSSLSFLALVCLYSYAHVFLYFFSIAFASDDFLVWLFGILSHVYSFTLICAHVRIGLQGKSHAGKAGPRVTSERAASRVGRREVRSSAQVRSVVSLLKPIDSSENGNMSHASVTHLRMKIVLFSCSNSRPYVLQMSPCILFYSMALDEGLASDLAVQSALEEADDAMTFAKKAQATASKAHVLSSRKNIDLAVQRVSKVNGGGLVH